MSLSMTYIWIFAVITVAVSEDKTHKIISQLILRATEVQQYGCINLIMDDRNMAKMVTKYLISSFIHTRTMTVAQYFENKHNDCISSTNALLSATKLSEIKFKNWRKEKWMIFSKGNRTAEEIFTGVDVPFDSMVVVVIPSSANFEFVRLEVVYRVKVNFPLRRRIIANFNYTFLHNKLDAIPIIPQRLNLEGLHFTTGANMNVPTSYLNYNQLGKDGSPKIEGYVVEIFKVLSSIMNFRFTAKWFPVPTGALHNGEWTGLTGKLKRGEIDVILTSFNMASERMDIAEFPGTLLRSKFQIYSFSGPSHSTFKTLFKPLTIEVWMVVAAWVVVVASSIKIFTIIRRANNLDEGAQFVLSAFEAFYFVLQSLSLQASSIIPKAYSLRGIMLVAYFTASVLLPMYSASLISSLTQRTPFPPFKTLKELAGTDFTLMVSKDGADYNFLMGSNDPYVNLLFTTKTELMDSKRAGILSYVEGIRDVCSFHKRKALLADELVFDYQATHLYCKMSKLEENLPFVHQSFALQKDSAYIDLFRQRILQLKEWGLLARFQRKYWREQVPDISSYIEVTLDDVSPIFLMFALSNCVSLIILGFEIFIYKIEISSRKVDKAYIAKHRLNRRHQMYNLH